MTIDRNQSLPPAPRPQPRVKPSASAWTQHRKLIRRTQAWNVIPRGAAKNLTPRKCSAPHSGARGAMRPTDPPSRGRFHRAPLARREQVDDERDHDARHRDDPPFPVEPILHRRIPEQRGGQKDEAENRRQHIGENSLEPIREQIQQRRDDARNQQRQNNNQQWHTNLLRKGSTAYVENPFSSRRAGGQRARSE